jgi:hypothetical protein
MTEINPPGYPLPAGDLGEDELVCQLVYLPDRPEYWQALLAAVHYFATWKAWQRDDDKRGKDAAANWRSAFELTIGCWRMTCLEELISDVAAMRALMELRKDCCDDNITFDIVDEVETDIEPGVGDPPALYGETEIETWDDWEEHVCYNAHLYVDNLKNIGDTLWEVVKENSLYLGVIAAVLALAAFAGIGAAVAYLTVSGIVAIIAGSATISTFSDTKDDLEAAREDIVCALIQGGDLAAAVEAALGSGAAWDLFYRWVPYDTAMAIIHDGGHDGEYLPAETREDCVCEEEEAEYQEVWHWESDIEDPWRMIDDAFWSSGAVVMGGNSELQAWAGEMRVYLGLGSVGSISISRLAFDYKRSTTDGSPKVRIIHDGGTWEWVYDDMPANVRYNKEVIFDPPLVVTHPANPFIRFMDSHSGNICRNYWTELDMDAS